jgi:hypothetical protein
VELKGRNRDAEFGNAVLLKRKDNSSISKATSSGTRVLRVLMWQLGAERLG